MNPFFLDYSDDNKKNAFNNGGSDGHRVNNVASKQIFLSLF